MPSNYPLEDLGPETFERLAVALARELAGPGVNAFGRGPDGGREATYQGNLEWQSPMLPGEPWSGLTVFQAKHKADIAPNPVNDYAWLRLQIARELDSWLNPDSRRTSFPNNIAFITNARLSGVSGSGGYDQISAFIELEYGDALRRRGAQSWWIIHRDTIIAELNRSISLRAAFPGLLTAGDVLARLQQISQNQKQEELRDVLVDFTRETLKSERWLHFSEAGGDGRNLLHDVVVDLPVMCGESNESALHHVVSHADRVLSLRPGEATVARHIVLTGSPGNGKSTLARYVAQLYRSRFLEDDLEIGMGKDTSDGTLAAARRMGVPEILNRRWPILIRLTDLADRHDSTSTSLWQFIARRVTELSGNTVQGLWVKDWVKKWPSLFIFDGLDEVTSIQSRQRVIDLVEEFRDGLDTLQADALLLVTTRPTGYTSTDQLDVNHFRQVDLQYLSPAKAIEYGRRVIGARLTDDRESIGILNSKLELAIYHPVTENLSKTPLQVVIMVILLERLGRLPTHQYQLFSSFFETIYTREASKPLSQMGEILTKHRQAISKIHALVGLRLQYLSERDGESSASLATHDFEVLIRDHLRDDLGFPEDQEMGALVRSLNEAAMTRLVLLGPRGEGIGFEIRPLQELMAAQALTDCTDDQLRRRLLALAPSPHWRNTWHFMSGRVFAESQPSRWDIVTACVGDVDQESDWPGWLCPIGPGLAAELLEYGVTSEKPKWEQRLLDVALRAVNPPIILDFESVRAGLAAAGIRPANLARIRGTFEASAAGPDVARRISLWMWSSNNFGGQILGWTRVQTSVPDWGSPSQCSPVPLGTVLKGRTATVPDEPRSLFTVLAGVTVLQVGSRIWPHPQGGDRRVSAQSIDFLMNPDSASGLRTRMSQLGADQWVAQLALSQVVCGPLSRKPMPTEFADEGGSRTD